MNKNIFIGFVLLLATMLLMTSCTQEGRMRMKAKRGDPQAMHDYGAYLIRYYPNNFYSDWDEGKKWIEEAANNGHIQSMERMGSINAMGYKEEHKKLAVHWYLRAAECGSTTAMLELGKAYRFGDLGLVADDVKADYWFQRIKDQKIKEADLELAPLRQRAEKGDVQSMLYMGRSQESRGQAFWKEAAEWYARAGEAGNAEACMRLVEAYKDGKIGLPRDAVKCDQWFRKWQQAMRRNP